MKPIVLSVHLPFAVCFLFFTLSMGAQESASLAKIDSIIHTVMSANKITGLSLGIIKGGKVYLQKGYGSRAIGEEKPVDSMTNFVTCSISKLFTATAIMQLVEQGKIDIHKKLIDYLPDFQMNDERYQQITIEQMLTHTSGLPNIAKRHFINPENDSVALTEFAKKLKSKRLAYPPGVQLSSSTYSNTAYDILGRVIEVIANQTYASYVEQHILAPVGMSNSSFFYQHIPVERRGLPHTKNWITGAVHQSNYYPDIPQDNPCGNLNSCSQDLCKWMIYNLGIYNGSITDGIIRQKTLQQMWTTTHRIPPYKTSIGLGWWVVDSDKYGKYFFHVGNDPGFSATLNVYPASDIGIIVLTNAEYARDAVWNKIPGQIMDVIGR